MVHQTPRSLEDAARCLAEGSATIIAGGTDIYPALSSRGLPKNTLDLGLLSELRQIELTETTLRLGALVTWSDIADAKLPPALDGLRQAATQIGGVQIQNSGTLGGNLCNASPAADSVPPLLTLDASVTLTSLAGDRRLPLAEFITDVRKTSCRPDEFLTGIEMPLPPPDARASFEKLGSRKYLVISIAMVAAVLRLDKDGHIADARIAIGACSPVAQRLPDLEASLVGQSPRAPDLPLSAFAGLSPISDPRGTADYRHRCAQELCRRAIQVAGIGHG